MDAERQLIPTPRRDVWSHLAGSWLPVVGIAALSFWARLLLSGRNSYWLDELYSVYQYVVLPESLRSAIASLAETSIHPPVFQTLLYGWVQVFGDTEVATRSLSNLALSVAVVFVFQLTRRAYGTFAAYLAAVAYTVSFAAVYFGMEARSYGLTMAVSTASSLAAVVYLLQRRGGERASRQPAGALCLVALFAANLGLMLTHYYNFFFIVAQALFVGVATLVTGKRPTRLRRLGAAVGAYLAQLAVFAVVWGPITVRSYTRNEGRYEAEEISYTPVRILRAIGHENLAISSVRTLVLAALAVVAITYLVTRGYRTWRRSDRVEELLTTTYLIWLLVGSSTVAYVAFNLASAERFNWRYFIYLVPPLLMLLAALADSATQDIAAHLRERTMGDGPARAESDRYRISAGIVAILVVGLLVLPDSLRAGQWQQDDWRGTAQEMLDLIDSNPDARFAILEPSFRAIPMFDYYLDRFASDVRVHAPLRMLEERRGSDFVFEREAAELAEFDYLLVPFTHHRTTHFPETLGRLQEMHDVAYWRTNDDNKGIVIFAVNGERMIDG